MRTSSFFLSFVISCWGVGYQHPSQGSSQHVSSPRKWEASHAKDGVNQVGPSGIVSGFHRTQPKFVQVDQRKKKDIPHFLVAPPSSHETSGVEIYVGPRLQIAVGSLLQIQVTSRSNVPCIVRMEARYANGALAGEWRAKGPKDDVLRVDSRVTIPWKAGMRPGLVTIRAFYRSWQTGESKQSVPEKITLVRPMTLIDYGAWERDGNGWKRRVTVRAALSQFGEPVSGVPLRLRVATPAGIAPSASRLEQVKGTAARDGSFTTIQHWRDWSGASLDLDDYAVVAEVVQPS